MFHEVNEFVHDFSRLGLIMINMFLYIMHGRRSEPDNGDTQCFYRSAASLENRASPEKAAG